MHINSADMYRSYDKLKLGVEIDTQTTSTFELVVDIGTQMLSGSDGTVIDLSNIKTLHSKIVCLAMRLSAGEDGMCQI